MKKTKRESKLGFQSFLDPNLSLGFYSMIQATLNVESSLMKNSKDTKKEKPQAWA
jgi:hypothetical protein